MGVGKSMSVAIQGEGEVGCKAGEARQGAQSPGPRSSHLETSIPHSPGLAAP